MTTATMRIGYVPYSPSLTRPGDARRFPCYARQRGLPFEVARQGREYDLVILSARADITSWVDTPPRTKIVYDVIDSYMAIPRSDMKNLLRGPAKFVARETRRFAVSYQRAIGEMCSRADAVVCTTEEQRRSLTRFSPNVHAILDIHTDLVRSVKEDYRSGAVLNLAWEGLPENLRAFSLIAPALRDLSAQRPIALHCVTDLRFARYLNRFRWLDTMRLIKGVLPGSTYLYQWNSLMLSRIVTACDLAVVPLDLTDALAAGKPENKLLLFWRMGMPTLTSATPANARSMALCGLNMACGDLPDWRGQLQWFAADEEARSTAGKRGLAFTREHHSEVATWRRWDAVLESLGFTAEDATGSG